ncbi:MAG TPA: helix-turn-helix domain-containing protein [Burkholderiaceae bacterium]|jgi:HTH-type transcriptional regulator/antitoxin HipB|nr:helix-turn-helix domain-containing protein [Burkholderiaceae bacterium]
MDFPIHLTSQLREHLRALRKARGLTQAALGRLIGVGQARIAEIESNPGAVSVDQLMKVVSALRASLVLRDDVLDATANRPEALASLPIAAADKSRTPVNTPPTGEWRMQPLTGGDRQTAPVLASRTDAKTASDAQALRDANPNADVTPTSRRSFVIRPKQGSW